LLLPLIATATLGSWFLLHGGDSRAQNPIAGAVPEVTVAQALTRKVSDSAEFTGRVEPVNTAEVRPRVDGFVESVQFQEGAIVHKGEVLFQLDARPYKAEV